MTDELDGLTPEQIAELKAHWDKQVDAEEEAKKLTWPSFVDWLRNQTDLLRKNPGLLEMIVQMGPGILDQIMRIFA